MGLGGYRMVDLTHSIDPFMPSWSDTSRFSFEVETDYEEGCRTLNYSCAAGLGTHVDAPAHFFRDGKMIAELALEELIVPLCVINVSAQRSPDLFIQPKDIVQFEEKWGEIERGSFACGYTGWDSYWNETERYRNVDGKGKMRFPGFSKEAAELLLARGVMGIGIDTLSPDGGNEKFPVHEAVLGAGKIIVENLARLAEIPAKGAIIGMFPMKVGVGTEAPARCVAFIPK